MIHFFTGGSINIINTRIDLKLKHLVDGFVSCSFLLHKTLIDVLEWCGLLL